MLDLKIVSSLIVFLPFIGGGIAGFFGKIIGRTATHVITTSLVGIASTLAFYLFYISLYHQAINLNLPLYTWGITGGIAFNLGFLIDNLSIIMLSIVSFISLLVHIYTIGYMQDDPGYQRFFCYISLFTGTMFILVTANNFLQLFFAWEGVGLFSYLLIGFWHQKEQAAFASFKAFIVNRIADVGFLIGIAAIFSVCSSLDYTAIFIKIPILPKSYITFICLSLFIGAMGKSAQVPLHVWLPDSMEGPTPISALIHAATMVTAGVFMVARMAPLFNCSELAQNVMLIIGGITCLSMGILAVVQDDIKRIIAYSTLSQLGLMVTALGASAYVAAIFHLMTHAFYKALLFLGAGAVIVALQHEQNIQRMGGLRKYMPITYYCMLIGALALIGFPGFSGYFSKELIIEAVGASHLSAANFAYWAVVIGVYFTALYTFRLILLVFFTKSRILPHNKPPVKKVPIVILCPLIILAIPSIFSGWWFVDKLNNYFAVSVLVASPNSNMHLTVGALLLGLATAWVGYIKLPYLPSLLKEKLHFLYTILVEKYGFDLLYQNILAPIVRFIGNLAWKFSDALIIDNTLVNGSVQYITRLGKFMRYLQTGYLYHYTFVMITGFFSLFIWLMFR